jgi:hypothetical protein
VPLLRYAVVQLNSRSSVAMALSIVVAPIGW